MTAMSASTSSATKEEISKENVIFKTLPAKVDAVFYFPLFGQKPTKRKTAGGVVQKNNRPEPDNIMSISSGAKGETISEKVFNIIQTIESSGDISIKKSPVPDLLLASLFAETDQLQKNLNEETLTLASSLIKLRRRQRKNRRYSQRQKPVLRKTARAGAGQKLPERVAQKHVDFYRRPRFGKTGAEPNPALFGKK